MHQNFNFLVSAHVFCVDHQSNRYYFSVQNEKKSDISMLLSGYMLEVIP